MKKGFFASTITALTACVLVTGALAQQPAPKQPPAKPPAAGAKPGAPTVTGNDGGTRAAATTAAGDAGASAEPTSGAAAFVGDAGVSGSVTTVPTTRKMHPPPPPPTPQQVAALEAMKVEVDAYERGARDYRDTVTSIIKFHYEAKKKEVLSGLDQEIAIEKAELKKAREIAIKRLEEFIATYSGPRSQPEATPDAMYRLAALYEERARSEDATEPVDTGLKPAIALYKRVIVEYPQYRELAGIYYFLGHALNDSGRVPEAQQVWRSLVCHNHFPYPVPADPKDPEKDTIKPMPQDADEAHWTAWRRKYTNPKSPNRKNPETVYSEVYPDSCQHVPQPERRAGEDPKYVPEIWWQIGNWEFDQLDFPSGVTKEDPGSVWGYNRAASAYTKAMKFKKPPLYGVSLYKYAWTLFKQQRYELATKEFVKLLVYTDEQEKATGDKGADFRGEAYTYIAGSLTNIDFKGPEEWEPFILRPDILDTEPNPDRAEKKLHVAIDRVKDPNVIPQDKPWTIEIYRGLAYEFRSLNQFNNAIETYETMLQKWECDPSAPETQNAIAETYDQLNVTKRPGTPEHDQTSQKALEARTKLANYIGNTKWVDCNKDNPAAIQNAERLVRGGLRQAAAAHTNNGKAALVAANETNEPGRQVELLSRAATEYKLAAIGWEGYLKQDDNAPDAYESRYWLADARRQYVRIQVVLNKIVPKTFNEPSKKDITDAYTAAVEVRDSNEDDKYLDNAAFFAVDVSDVDRDLAYARSAAGGSGIPQRGEVKFDSEDVSTRKVIREPIPAVVQQSMNARDEYVQRVPPSLDPQHRALDYQFYVAEQYFLYGQFDQAETRYTALWQENCGKNEFGYKAWERLITMAAVTRDADKAQKLAEAEKNHTCAVNAEQAAKSGGILKPIGQEAAYVKARKKFEEACEAPMGTTCKNPDAPAKKPIWREAGGLYEAALEAAPARDEAPEGAMNAAYAYKQVGEYNKAIGLYNKFISEYGSDARLDALQKGDPKAKTGPDPKKYNERLKYLGDAYDALGTTYYSFFNYQRAAETYEKVSANPRFDEKRRRDAAKNSMILYANMAQRDKMLAQYRLLNTLHPTPEDKANADYLVGSFYYKQWDPKGGDGGTNRQTRLQAEQGLMDYYAANQRNAGAGKFLVESAYAIARMKKSAADPGYRQWYRSTITSWDNYNRGGAKTKEGKSEAQLPPYVDYAAEAEFTLLDEEITTKWDVPEKHKYPATVPEIMGEVATNPDGTPKKGPDGQVIMAKKGKYLTNAEEAQKWDLELENRIVKKYESVEWVPAAIARQGAVFDTLRSGLYNTVKVKLMSAKVEATLNQMRNSGRDDLINKADALEDAFKDFWRTKKQKELDGADEVMVRRYATAVSYGRKYNVKNMHVTRALARLAYYTDIIGDAKMAQYVTNAPDPATKGATKMSYTPNQYVQSRSGLTALPPPSGNQNPLPAAP